SVLPGLDERLTGNVGAEIHGSALELRTGPQSSVQGAIGELAELRRVLRARLGEMNFAVAAAGMHPTAVWQETRISGGDRYQLLYDSLRELARREPTFALHVHVAVADPDDAIRAMNGLRAHLPLLLALSANSPFWQGRASGLASTRTPMFGAFPRVGLPRAFADYAQYAAAVDMLLRCGAIPDPTYVWWDVRPQPRWGTVEVRIMDAQITVADSAALVALVQSLVHLEVVEGAASPAHQDALPEVLAENRFIAARDGMDASFLDERKIGRVDAHETLRATFDACVPHAEQLGCGAELEGVLALSRSTGTQRQLAAARGPHGLAGLVTDLVAQF
ncbi:MAG: carboxylate-amine ligase, partial [Solirubrobacteraceae bacterium]